MIKLIILKMQKFFNVQYLKKILKKIEKLKVLIMVKQLLINTIFVKRLENLVKILF